MEYKSTCRACHHYPHAICTWQVHKTGRMKLKLVYGDSKLWGIGPALHTHFDDVDGKGGNYRQFLDIYNNETFEYEQEVDCGCSCYVPSDNLEFLEWKYEQSE